MLLLTFEGIDGSGKSTQARRLTAFLREEGRDPLLVREPGGTELSEQLRTVLLDTRSNMHPMAELLLFSAARTQLVAERIRPALEAGRIVICDRFYDSTTAYQGAGRRVADPAWLQSFHRRVTDGLVPDRTFLVALAPERAQERREANEEPADRMEAEADAFHERVAAAYETLAREHPQRIQRLDGRRSVEALQATIRADVEAPLRARPGTSAASTGSPEC